MCVPLHHGQRVLGVLEALNPRAPDQFAQRDLALLEAFATVVAAALERARVVSSLRDSNVELRAAAADRYQLVLGPSAAMRSVVELARRAATASTTVLLLGESGTGKEVVARAIHGWSPRADAPFVAVNCTALTPELLESELFGHERGAFTGAVAAKKGRFELADGGTLFLDEIGELAPQPPGEAPARAAGARVPAGRRREGRSASTCGSSRRRTATSRPPSGRAASARTCSIA